MTGSDDGGPAGRVLGGFSPDWPAPPGVCAWVTERAGGVSTGGYASLNLGAHVGDDPANVAANRGRLAGALELPQPPAWLEQVHGTAIYDLDAGNAENEVGLRSPPRCSGLGPADGAVTGRRGVVAAVMTADCLPVLFCDRAGERVGVAHAGWRGLAAGVLPAAVAALRCVPQDLIAWLGPAIGPDAYEVGDDVRTAFPAPAAAAAFRRNDRGRWQADLYALARLSLADAGVREVHGGGFCTFAARERFFSHRREAPCGRMATLIWRR